MNPFFCIYCKKLSSSFDCHKRHVLRHKSKYQKYWHRRRRLCFHKKQCKELKPHQHEICSDINGCKSILYSLLVNKPEHQQRYNKTVTAKQRCKMHQHGSQSKICQEEFSGGHLGKPAPRSVHGMMSYTCRVCSLRFASEERRNKHELILGHTYEYIKMVNEKFSGNNHRAIHKNYECQMCSQRFASEEECKKHQLLLHTCEYCEMKFHNDQERMKHLINMHPEVKREECEVSLFKCQCCGLYGKTFRTKEELQNHEKMHQCQVSQKLIPGKKQRKAHLLIHMKPYKCQMCSRRFVSQEECSKHELKAHTCPYCKKMLHNYNERIIHIGNMHPEIKCQYCSKTFRTKEELQNHEKTHQCEICQKIFGNSREQKAHMSIHKRSNHELKVHTCTYCKMMFPNFDEWSNHIRNMHPEIKCQYCKKIFRTTEEIKNHEKTHQCGICQKMISGSFQELQVHWLIHMKNCKCQMCSKDFCQRKNIADMN